MLYAGPVSFPNGSSSAVGRLQRLQNAGLLIEIGSLQIPSISHLRECAMLSVSYLLKCRQYWDAALPRTPYALRRHLLLGFRAIRKTLRFLFWQFVRHLLTDGVLSHDQHRCALRSFHWEAVDAALAFHSEAVDAALAELGPIKVFGLGHHYFRRRVAPSSPSPRCSVTASLGLLFLSHGLSSQNWCD